MNDEKKRALIVGGGFGGLETALYLRSRLAKKVDVTLVSEKSAFVFKPYLTFVPFGLRSDNVRFDLADLAAANGFRFQQGIAHEVEPEHKVLRLSEQDLFYDVLFLATGASARSEEVPGLHDHGFVLGREGDMMGLRRSLNKVRSDVRGGAQRRIVLLVPPGCQWAGALYELAFMLATWLSWKEVRDGVGIVLLTAERYFMEVFGSEVHDVLQDELKDRGIDARRWQRPVRVEQDAVVFSEEGRLGYDLLIAAPSHRSSVRWNALPTDERGFLRTELSSRRVEGHTDIYAVGDASDHPVKQGFLALLQADAAAEDWSARLLGEEPAFTFEPKGTWLMEQLDQGILTHGRLDQAVLGVEDAPRVERLPVGQLRRILASEHLPRGKSSTNPLYSGLLWKGTKMGVKVLKHLTNPKET